jgi:hypothetical protein
MLIQRAALLFNLKYYYYYVLFPPTHIGLFGPSPGERNTRETMYKTTVCTVTINCT